MSLKTFHFPFLIITLLTSSLPFSIAQNRALSKITADRMVLEESHNFSMQSLKDAANSDINEEYQLLKANIEILKSLNTVLKEESQLLEKTLDSNRILLDSLQERILKNQAKYASILRMLYRQKLVKNDFLFLLSSESLNKAIIKYRYLKQFEDYVLKESEKIKSTQNEINLTNADITNKMLELNQNKNKQERILLELQEEQENKQKLIVKIKQNKTEIGQKLQKKESIKQKSSSFISQKENDPFSLNSAPETKIHEESIENASFLGKKTNLIWPVDQGIVIEKFGRRPHDIVQNIWIENNGIGIRTSPGENVKSVFKGIVKQTPKIDVSGYMIIIEHGDYLTSYFSIASIFVHKGDHVNEGQIIGQMSKSPTNSPTFNFEIWKGYEKLNPELWLKKRM